MVWQANIPFWTIDLGNILTTAIFGVGFVTYVLNRKTESRERKEGQEKYRAEQEENIRRQERMHTENREKLNYLGIFRESQEKLNAARDVQISALTALVATTTEALRGFNRRLEMMESRERGERDR